MTPDRRRAFRTIVHTVGALVMIGYLGWIIDRLPPDLLKTIGWGLIFILALREVSHGAENVTARIKFKAGLDGADVEVDPENQGER